jgi:hypothetical protein
METRCHDGYSTCFSRKHPRGGGVIFEFPQLVLLKKIIILLNSTQQIEDVSIQQLM